MLSTIKEKQKKKDFYAQKEFVYEHTEVIFVSLGRILIDLGCIYVYICFWN